MQALPIPTCSLHANVMPTSLAPTSGSPGRGRLRLLEAAPYGWPPLQRAWPRAATLVDGPGRSRSPLQVA
ncbi:hypothetical protein B296_00030842 [Ensete ventricosum]|uniref:Uncharacterized protein n=1 Tax=Ensete ventricosum TaxID=4639 RepID=A0A426XM05_ENSVE|nr:hypothetical protein B296_00030842 [Ensete ventricosum]